MLGAPFKALVLAAAVAMFATFLSGAPADAARLTVVNNSRVTIERLFVSACRRKSWGDDQLGDDRIEPGGRVTLTLTPGCYDLQVETPRGRECEITGEELRGDRIWTLTSEMMRTCE